MKNLYLECSAGISGDMFTAAMLDLGADEDKLLKALDSLDLDGFEIKISKVKKSGIQAVDFDVIIEGEDAGKDHDMEYLHGSKEHHHHHHHDHEHHHHHHEHRHLPDILKIIDGADITDTARELAVKIFSILAAAEAKAHGIPENEVHFHEVGAVDSIVDIIAGAVCFDDLGFEKVFIPVLNEGRGTVRCAHGILPVPVPAVANIIAAEGLDISIMDVDGEFITPTGAAIAAAIITDKKAPGRFAVNRIGLGAGKREYERPSILRAMDIESEEYEPDMNSDVVVKLETDIDDSNGECLGYTMDKLLTAGAREVHFFPIQMKKNRPGTELVVLCGEDEVEKMERIIFENTTTIGIRRIRMQRTLLKRSEVRDKTEYGEIAYKRVVLPDGSVRDYPEYESIRKVADECDMGFFEAREKTLRTHYDQGGDR